MRDKVILGLLILFFGVNQCYADKQKQIVVSDTTIQVQEFDLGKKESDNNKLKKPQTITSTVTHARKLKRENKIDILQKKCESLGFQVDSLSHICDSLQTSNKDIQIKYDISIINQNSLKEESESWR